MLYHIYIKDNGCAAIMESMIDLNLFPGYQYFGVSEDRFYFEGKQHVNGQWVPIGSDEPEYQKMRRFSYPTTVVLLQALWQAMDTGVLPKVPGFYDKMKEVNDQFPPPK